MEGLVPWYSLCMEVSNNELVTLLKQQNELLRKLYDSQVKLNKAQKQREWLQIGLKLLPFVIVLVVFLWLYLSIMSTLNDLTSQVNGIRESVNSTFGLLTEQFSKMDAYFSSLLNSLKGLFPDLGNFPDLIKDHFLSS